MIDFEKCFNNYLMARKSFSVRHTNVFGVFVILELIAWLILPIITLLIFQLTTNFENYENFWMILILVLLFLDVILVSAVCYEGEGTYRNTYDKKLKYAKSLKVSQITLSVLICLSILYVNFFSKVSILVKCLMISGTIILILAIIMLGILFINNMEIEKYNEIMSNLYN